MKIVFDYKIFYQQKYGGISNYFLSLYEEISKINLNNYFICPIHKNKYLKKNSSSNIYGYYFNNLPTKLNFFFNEFNQLFSTYLIKKIKPNIIHETYYSEKDYYNKIKTKKVCTVFDMIN